MTKTPNTAKKSAKTASKTAVQPKPRRLIFKALLPLLVLAAAAATFLNLARSKPETKPRETAEKAWIVRTVDVAVADHRPQLKLYGEVVAGRKVDLRALVAGEIIDTSAKFREGGTVAKSDPLIRIDPFDFKASLAEARANLNEAKAKLVEAKARIGLERTQIQASENELQLAERDLTRGRQLFKQKLVAQKVVDDRQYIVSQRKQNLSRRQSNLSIEQAKAAQQEAALLRLESLVRRAERNLKNTSLKAPFNAYISAINAETGQMVNTNDRIATLIDADRIDVRFNFSNSQYGRLLEGGTTIIGLPLQVIWRVGSSELNYPAAIERVAAQITAASGGVEIYARLANPAKPVPLRPGAFVEVLINDRLVPQATRLPETALYDGARVFVVNGKRRLEARKVELLGYAENDILVRGALKPGERVITTRISQAKPGLLVEVK